MKRLFIAMELPADARHAVATGISPIRRKGFDVKWVATENLHLTLKFLGNTPDDQVEAIREVMERCAAGLPPLHLSLQGMGAFPSARKPRVLWVGMQGEVEPLAGLARALDRELEPLGFVPENRPFSPHITTGRARRGGRLPSMERLFPETEGEVLAEFVVGEIVLFESTLTPSGPIYTRAAVVTLGG